MFQIVIAESVSITCQSAQFIDIPEFPDSGRKSWTLDAELWTLNSGRWTLDAGLWMLDPGRWTLDTGPWALDSGLWTLDSGRWTLDSGRWALYPVSVTDCCRTESEPSFWSCLTKLLKILSMRISEDHRLACSVETVGCDLAIFRNSILTLSVTL